MTLEKARGLPAVQADIDAGFNRNAGMQILTEVLRDHGRDTVDAFIRELDPEQLFGFKTGLQFTAP